MAGGARGGGWGKRGWRGGDDEIGLGIFSFFRPELNRMPGIPAGGERVGQGFVDFSLRLRKMGGHTSFGIQAGKAGLIHKISSIPVF